MLGLDIWGFRMGVLWAVHLMSLPSTWMHRLLLGRHVGSGLRIGRGGVIVGRSVKIGRSVSIGSGSEIVADEIEIADGVTIGAGVTIRCKRLSLGPRSRIDDRTRVYGVATPNSALVLGAHAWIYPDCHLNTDEEVRLGVGSAMGARSLVFTHSSYLPITAGYPVTIASVTIGNYVWLPWQVFILPGARIDDGATVGACSLVGGHIPRNSLAVGVPARVVKDEGKFRRRYDVPAMAALARTTVERALTNVVGGFRAREIFRPKRRSLVSLGANVWLVTRGSESTPVVLFDGITPIMQREFAGALVITVGAATLPLIGAHAVDLVTFDSRLGPAVSATVLEIMSALSDFGIRFGWATEELPFPAIVTSLTDSTPGQRY
jgi:acetyltransferase-like isoleucine patch superfamily enzyme